MSSGSVVSYFNSNGEFASLLKRYVDAVDKKDAEVSFSKQDMSVFTLYLKYANNRCYVETNAHFEKVAQIAESGPIFETAQKIQKALYPMAALCAQGKERVEKAKRNPAEGPRAHHWLALYLNELNLASLDEDRGAMKAAIKKIDFMQRQITLTNERTRLVNELCIQRINQIDFDESMRNELFTWSGYLKAQAIDWSKHGLLMGLSTIMSMYSLGGDGSKKCFYRRLSNVIGTTVLLKMFQMTAVGIFTTWHRVLFRKQDISLIKQFSSEEKEKFIRIQNEALAVASLSGLSANFEGNFLEITEESSMWASGDLWSNPILGMSKEIFDNYESKEAREWRALLDELPDDPLDLARFLDQVSPEKRTQIEMLAKKGEAYDQKTIQGAFAHELGHLRNHDSPTGSISSIFVQALLQSLILYTDTEAQWPVSRVLLAEEYFIPRYLPQLFDVINAPFSQYKESKADLHANISSEWQEGVVSFFKQSLVCEWAALQKNPNASLSFETAVKEMLKSFDLGCSHPNFAKRLDAAIKNRGTPYEPSPPFYATAQVAFVAAVHLSLLALQIVHLSYSGSDILFKARDSFFEPFKRIKF